ncbi:unnamed protein product [Tenebrio molitor]|nr:unnamed protein product [Tenebrio molitor]
MNAILKENVEPDTEVPGTEKVEGHFRTSSSLRFRLETLE